MTAASESFAVHQAGLAALNNYAAMQQIAVGQRLQQFALPNRPQGPCCLQSFRVGQEPAGPASFLPV